MKNWFAWFFKVVSWFFIVFGWFPWFFKVVSWFFMVFGWFPWFFKVVSWFFIVFGWFPGKIVIHAQDLRILKSLGFEDPQILKMYLGINGLFPD